MPYLLDGNNLIGAARPTGEDRSALIAELADRLRRTKARAILFFDGEGERNSVLGGLAIRFAGGRTADEAIVEEVRASRAPQEMLVVTADRHLASRIRDLGARAIAPGEFWERLGRGPSRPAPGAGQPVDVEEWTRYFEDEKNREK